MRWMSPASGFGVPEVVGGFEAQPCVPVAHRGEAEAVHGRVLRGVRELVDVVDDEVAARQADRGAGGVVVPAARRNLDRHVVEVHAMRQLRLGLVEVRGRIAQGVRRAAGHDVLVVRPGDRRAVRVLRDRQSDRRVEVRAVGAGRLVPAAPHHRVAARHQERVRKHVRVGDRAGVVAAAADTRERGPCLAAAVRRFVHDLVRARVQVAADEAELLDAAHELGNAVRRRDAGRLRQLRDADEMARVHAADARDQVIAEHRP